MTNVIDANCWHDFVSEWVDKDHGIGTQVFASAKAHGGLLLDAENLMKQQYVSSKRPFAEQLFDSWFEQTFQAGHLTLITIAGTNNCHRELTGLGLPKKEHIYFRVAIHGGAERLVSRDIDFFDPSKKGVGGEQREKLMKKANGPVCKHMKKAYGVEIFCPSEFVAAYP